jgi:hypothetical protein
VALGPRSSPSPPSGERAGVRGHAFGHAGSPRPLLSPVPNRMQTAKPCPAQFNKSKQRSQRGIAATKRGLAAKDKKTQNPLRLWATFCGQKNPRGIGRLRHMAVQRDQKTPLPQFPPVQKDAIGYGFARARAHHQNGSGLMILPPHDSAISRAGPVGENRQNHEEAEP